MKQIKIEFVLLVIAVGFVGLCFGLYLGKQHEPDTVTISTSRTVSQTSAQPAASQREEETCVESENRESAYIDGRLNINAATVEELTALPGIGETLAQRIVHYREQHGDFTTVDGLRNVSGIGEKRLEAIREYITVG